MAKLTYEERQKLPDSAFAVPTRRSTDGYPIPTPAQLRKVGAEEPVKSSKTHARNALARVSRFGTPREKADVCKMVAARHPEIHEEHCRCPECKKGFHTRERFLKRKAERMMR